MIIDAHSHIFPAVNGVIGDGKTRSAGYGCITVGDETLRLFPAYNERTEYTAEMLIAHLDWAGVDKAVLQQGTFYGECNAYVHDALDRYPERLLGALHADPWCRDYRESFEGFLETGRFCSVKIEFSQKTGLSGIHPGARLDDDAIGWLWKLVRGAGVPLVLDLCSGEQPSYQTGGVRKIAETHPDLKIVIAHLGQPRGWAELGDHKNGQMWQEQIALGTLPNVWFDTSSLPDWEEDFPYPSAERYLQQAIGVVGPEKIMWGTDQPGTLKHQSYPTFLRLIQKHIAYLPADQRGMILGGNAERVYGVSSKQ